MTKSEELFESLCATSAIRAERVHIDRQSTPDYMLWCGNASIVIKVKQFDANPAPQHTLHAMDERHEGEAFYDSVPGERVRSKIDNAIPQFKRLSGGVRPTLLVLYDNVRLWPEICDSYAISVAMYGIETVLVAPEIAPDARGGTLVAQWPVASRKATSRANTTLSGIALLSDEGGQVAMQVFHNFFARNPIDPGLLSHAAITHYRHKENPDEVFAEWTQFYLQNP